MAKASIEFKGSSFTLSVLHLKTATLIDIREDLIKKVAQAPDFFYLVPIVVDIERVDGSIDYQAVRLLVEECKFTFVGFTGNVSKEQKKLIRELGFSFVNSANSAVNHSSKNSESVVASTKKIATDETIVSKVEQVEVLPHIALFTDKIHRGQIRSGRQKSLLMEIFTSMALYVAEQLLVLKGTIKHKYIVKTLKLN
jgi:septum site-determining protein MinC